MTMDDLFERGKPDAPLAERLRPRKLSDVLGQRHLLGPGMPLSVAFESGVPHSMILWGPPGTGKTTLARLTASSFGTAFTALSAVFSGVKEIREAVAQAEREFAVHGRRTILFVDEVHRFNKAQQDAFLPYVEQGTVTFIGATTENPSFEVNSALLSRANVYLLHGLTDEDLALLLERAVDALSGPVRLNEEARDRLIGNADGDARRLLNAVEILANAARTERRVEIDGSFVEKILSRSLRRFDKGGEQFYDQISALHKSVRGSDPDAALYWLVRMLDGGAEPLYLGRRMVRMAVEDIGLADPRALDIAIAACETYERLGSPEGELALAEAAIYLACSVKSNAVYNAYNAARRFVAADSTRPVPLHLRNAPTRLMKNLGYGADYRYAHDEPEAYAPGENYFPDGMPGVSWYRPEERGLEARIRERLEHLRSLDESAAVRDRQK
jgi:putative ATPase